MRIALICDWYAPRRGGIEAHLLQLAARLTSAGHDVVVITGTPGTDSVDGIAVHRLKATRLPVAGIVIDAMLAEEIEEVLRSLEVDLVHAHVSIVAPVALAGALAANRVMLPSVVTFHSFVPGTPLWAAIAGFVLGAPYWSSMMTAVSSRVVREVRAFAPAKTFHVLPNAVDASFWYPGSSPPSRGAALTFVYAGRLHSKKRPTLAVDAFAELHRAFPSLDSRLVLCGTGPLEASLRRRVAGLGLSDAVRFAGWQDADTLRDVFRAADVFLSPTLRESFGLAALEARACGLPVIAMRDSGVADFVAHGASGLLAESDRDFVRCVSTVARDASLRESLRTHNTAVRPTLTWDHAIREHLATYGAAMRSFPARPTKQGPP
jgi:glycosyltransferase involved in cell wall biosynthesis